MNKFPKYYHIGLPKTGTTTIQSILKKDDRINAVVYSRYFNTNSFFEEGYNHTSSERLTIETDENIVKYNNEKAGLELSLARIKKHRPDAQIIVTIRDQRDFLISAYKHFIRNGKQSKTFRSFLETEQGQTFLKLSDYHVIYQIIKTFFPSSNIHFLHYELLKNEYENFFAELYEIFELEPPIDMTPELQNIGKSDNFINFKNKLNALYIFRDGLWLHQLEELIHEGIIKIYEARSIRKPSSIFTWPQHDEFFKALEEEFRLSNQKFMEISNIDLKKYNYLL